MSHQLKPNEPQSTIDGNLNPEDPNTDTDREREREIPTMVTLRIPTESHQHRYYHQIVGTTIGKGFLFFLS